MGPLDTTHLVFHQNTGNTGFGRDGHPKETKRQLPLHLVVKNLPSVT